MQMRMRHNQRSRFRQPSGFFAIFKRKVYGTHHAISEQHLQRYLEEAEFEFNNRIALGIDDTARANNALKNIGGKRLTYRPVDKTKST